MIPKEIRPLIILAVVILICIVGGVAYCAHEKHKAADAKADTTFAQARTNAATDASDIRTRNEQSRDATQAEVKDAQDAIRNADPADRDRIARDRLRDLQGQRPR